MEENSEFCISHNCIDENEKLFAAIIGCIEEIVIDDRFLRKQINFLDKYWQEFEVNDENKLIYTDIFNQYVEHIEKYIESELIKRIPDFTMTFLLQQINNRQSELDGEIFEMLSTFTDFITFKTMFLDYRAMKEGKTIDFSQDLTVSKYSISE